MKSTVFFVAATSLLATAPVSAQDISELANETAVKAIEPNLQAEVATDVEIEQPVERLLPASTQLQLASDTEISSKKVEVGDKFTFSVITDISENGIVAIPRGSKVEGEITWKTGKAVGGKSGKFEVTFKSITVRDAKYTMTGMHRQEGKGNTVAAVFATWLVSGRSAVITAGQNVTALTAEPIPY